MTKTTPKEISDENLDKIVGGSSKSLGKSGQKQTSKIGANSTLGQITGGDEQGTRGGDVVTDDLSLTINYE